MSGKRVLPPRFDRNRPAGFITLVLLGSIITAGCTGGSFPFVLAGGDRVVSPQIIPVRNAPGHDSVEYRIPFQTTTVAFTLPINGSVYTGAGAADKEITIYGTIPEQDWVSQSYREMMEDSDQEECYRDLLGQLRQIRTRLFLSDDEYLELIAIFVQSIRYETVSENPPKFPIETVADRSGDCDDKSLLLAALLEREGYAVVLLSFRPESHMAVGIVCPGADYRGSGYAFLETTNVSYVGIPPDGLAGGVQVQSNPLVIPVGSGAKVYTACNQTRDLHTIYTGTESTFADLSREAEGVKDELRDLAATRNTNAYNQRVTYYNSLVSRLKMNAEVHNYILTHQYDRKGTYEWVKARLSGL